MRTNVCQYIFKKNRTYFLFSFHIHFGPFVLTNTSFHTAMDKSQELAILLQKKQTYSPSFHTLRSFSLHSYEQMLEHINKILETSSTPQYIEEKEKYQKILDFVNTSVCFLFPCRIPCFLSFICFLIPLTIHRLQNALHRSMKHQVFCFFFFFHSTHSRTSQSLYKSVEHRR